MSNNTTNTTTTTTTTTTNTIITMTTTMTTTTTSTNTKSLSSLSTQSICVDKKTKNLTFDNSNLIPNCPKEHDDVNNYNYDDDNDDDDDFLNFPCTQYVSDYSTQEEEEDDNDDDNNKVFESKKEVVITKTLKTKKITTFSNTNKQKIHKKIVTKEMLSSSLSSSSSSSTFKLIDNTAPISSINFLSNLKFSWSLLLSKSKMFDTLKDTKIFLGNQEIHSLITEIRKVKNHLFLLLKNVYFPIQIDQTVNTNIPYVFRISQIQLPIFNNNNKYFSYQNIYYQNEENENVDDDDDDDENYDNDDYDNYNDDFQFDNINKKVVLVADACVSATNTKKNLKTIPFTRDLLIHEIQKFNKIRSKITILRTVYSDKIDRSKRKKSNCIDIYFKLGSQNEQSELYSYGHVKLFRRLYDLNMIKYLPFCSLCLQSGHSKVNCINQYHCCRLCLKTFSSIYELNEHLKIKKLPIVNLNWTKETKVDDNSLIIPPLQSSSSSSSRCNLRLNRKQNITNQTNKLSSSSLSSSSLLLEKSAVAVTAPVKEKEKEQSAKVADKVIVVVENDKEELLLSSSLNRNCCSSLKNNTNIVDLTTTTTTTTNDRVDNVKKVKFVIDDSEKITNDNVENLNENLNEKLTDENFSLKLPVSVSDSPVLTNTNVSSSLSSSSSSSSLTNTTICNNTTIAPLKSILKVSNLPSLSQQQQQQFEKTNDTTINNADLPPKAFTKILRFYSDNNNQEDHDELTTTTTTTTTTSSLSINKNDNNQNENWLLVSTSDTITNDFVIVNDDDNTKDNDVVVVDDVVKDVVENIIINDNDNNKNDIDDNDDDVILVVNDVQNKEDCIKISNDSYMKKKINETNVNEFSSSINSYSNFDFSRRRKCLCRINCRGGRACRGGQNSMCCRICHNNNNNNNQSSSSIGISSNSSSYQIEQEQEQQQQQQQQQQEQEQESKKQNLNSIKRKRNTPFLTTTSLLASASASASSPPKTQRLNSSNLNNDNLVIKTCQRTYPKLFLQISNTQFINKCMNVRQYINGPSCFNFIKKKNTNISHHHHYQNKINVVINIYCNDCLICLKYLHHHNYFNEMIMFLIEIDENLDRQHYTGEECCPIRKNYYYTNIN